MFNVFFQNRIDSLVLIIVLCVTMPVKFNLFLIILYVQKIFKLKKKGPIIKSISIYQ